MPKYLGGTRPEIVHIWSHGYPSINHLTTLKKSNPIAELIWKHIRRQLEERLLSLHHANFQVFWLSRKNSMLHVITQFRCSAETVVTRQRGERVRCHTKTINAEWAAAHPTQVGATASDHNHRTLHSFGIRVIHKSPQNQWEKKNWRI